MAPGERGPVPPGGEGSAPLVIVPQPLELRLARGRHSVNICDRKPVFKASDVAHHTRWPQFPGVDLILTPFRAGAGLLAAPELLQHCIPELPLVLNDVSATGYPAYDFSIITVISREKAKPRPRWRHSSLESQGRTEVPPGSPGDDVLLKPQGWLLTGGRLLGGAQA